MANVSANTSWEVRSTATTITGPGGAGFDPALGGTDYSQQDSPQLTHADGVISGTNLQSTLGGFTAQMVGNCVYLSVSQTWRQITAFVNANNVTLLDAPAATSGNTFNVGGAYLVNQQAFQFPYQPGNTIWWRGSINPIVNQPNITSSDNTKFVRLRGYGTIRGDAGFGTIVGGSISADTFAVGGNAIVENMIFDGNGSQARNGVTMNGTYSCLQNCIIKGNVSTGGGVTILNQYNEVKNCYIDCHNSTGTPLNIGDVGTPASGCVIHHNVIRGSGATNGVTLAAGSFVEVHHNVIFGYASGSGIALFNGGSNWLKGASIKFNTIANSQKGVNILNVADGVAHLDIQGNIFSNLTSTAIWFNGTDLTTIAPGTTAYVKCDIDTNAFWNCAASYHNLPAGTGDITLTVDPFVDDVTTFDFHLNDVAGGGASCKGAWFITNPDGVTTSTFTVGALGTPTVAVVSTLAAASTAGVAPTIDEVQFPTGISEGATGGAVFQTIVMSAGTGMEARIPIMTHGRYAWNAATGLKSPTDMATITAFWLARQGRARGFRWKDWDDYQAADSPLTITGRPTAQLSKRYSSGLVNYDRVIYKPVTATLSIKRGGSTYAAWTVDTTTGIVTWTVINTKAITAITKAASAVVTVGASHGFSVGEVVYFTGVAGMVQINGLVGTITATAATTITVGIDSTAFSTYTSGGTANKYPQPSDTVLATFQFDVPVRFDTDVMQMTNDSSQIRRWDNLPVIELTGG